MTYPPSRIVSLLPACTEWIAAFDALDLLVARSHACDHPPEVRTLPALTSPTPDAVSGREIDQAVRDCVEGGDGMFEVDYARLAELKPDLILTQAQCRVCAVSLPDLEEELASWSAHRPDVFSMQPATFKQVLNDALRLGKLIGRMREAMDFVAGQERRLHALRSRLGLHKTSPADELQSVVCIEWLDPVMIAGHWVPDMVALGGGRALSAAAGEESQFVDWSLVRHTDPDVLAVMPCGYDLDVTVRELSSRFGALPGWGDMRAVRNGRVFAFDGNAYFSRPGPRLYRGVELIARALYPDEFDPEDGVDEWEMRRVRTVPTSGG